MRKFQISRRSSYIDAVDFELELPKFFEKSNLSYKAQPMIGGIRPDFLIEMGSENVVVEAKAWDDNVPLAKINQHGLSS